MDDPRKENLRLARGHLFIMKSVGEKAVHRFVHILHSLISESFFDLA